jgi:hypothetical protein
VNVYHDAEKTDYVHFIAMTREGSREWHNGPTTSEERRDTPVTI